mgnify:CR=1 FL=1
MRKRQAATGLLCGVLAAGMLACNAQADGSELKGPGNVTIKRLGYNVAFDPTQISWRTLSRIRPGMMRSIMYFRRRIRMRSW